MAKEIFCAYGVDVDAVAGWIGSYGGEGSPCDVSRGMFAGEVGTPRLLRLFERFGIRTTDSAHRFHRFPIPVTVHLMISAAMSRQDSRSSGEDKFTELGIAGRCRPTRANTPHPH